jgi:site-specific DNA-methyltransferase (adenine-specific)
MIGSGAPFAALLRRLGGTIPLLHRPDLAPFVHGKDNASAPIHRWLRYREAYSGRLIGALSLGRRILDPFCGCGSILLGAAQMGRAAVGIDVNPLAVFAARVKLTPLSAAQLGAVGAFVEDLAARLDASAPWPVPALSIAGKVFEPDVLDALLRLRARIEADLVADRACRDFLLLAWLAILERVGSYFKEGNGIKYRNRKRVGAGYVCRPEGRWQEARFGRDQKAFVLDRFRAQVRLMLDDAAHWGQGRWAEQRVVEGSVLEMDRLLGAERFDSVVFSPPYANRFDYFESMKVELWFGGFVGSYEAIGRLRKASLRSHLGADLTRPHEPVAALEQLIEQMDRGASSWRMGVPALLRGYFDDMRVTLRRCRKALDEGGRCFVVVGNSAFAGVIVPTDVLLAQLALENGFTGAEVLVTRHLTVAPQQRARLAGLEGHMRESVVALR